MNIPEVLVTPVQRKHYNSIIRSRILPKRNEFEINFGDLSNELTIIKMLTSV